MWQHSSNVLAASNEAGWQSAECFDQLSCHTCHIWQAASNRHRVCQQRTDKASICVTRGRFYYAWQQNASRVFAIVWTSVCPSVCLSVCPSVTLVICIKTVQARITKSSLWAAPRSLVYRDKISCHLVQGFFSNEGIEEGYPPKKTSFCRYWLE